MKQGPKVDSAPAGTGWAVVALGANQGDPVAAVEAAMARLEQRMSAPFLRSSLWSSHPVDCPDGSPLFINAVVAFPPPVGSDPEEFLEWTQSLERNFGRRPKLVMNEPRPLDLDLVAWGSLQRQGPRLVLPHPRAHLRRFVLEPLAEILPGLVLPGTGVPVDEMLQTLRTDEVLERLPPRPAAGAG